MTKKTLIRGAVTGALMLAAGTAFAHAHLEHTSPADGAKMDASPKAVEMEFGDPVVLTQLEVKHGDMMMPMDFKPSSNAKTTFSVALPSLEAGSYSVSWSALSEEDGHAMKGHFSFTVAAH